MDSADPGNQEAASLSCASVSFWAKGPTSTSSTSHRASTSHLARRPQTRYAVLRFPFIPTSTGPGKGRGAVTRAAAPRGRE
ncbi:hypothetical protein GCM10009540_08370 [Streptomyces turgidiscabies]